MVASAMFLIAACGNSEELSKTKTEETPEIEQNEEKETSKKEKETKIVDLTFEKESENELNLVSNAEGEELLYAFYVIKDNEFYEKFGYQKDNSFSYTVTEPGDYKVRVFVKDKAGNKITKDTEVIDFAF